MKMTDRIFKTVIIIEVQLILLLLVVLLSRSVIIEKKIYRTNTFMYEIFHDQKLEDIKELESDDIVIGLTEAPLTVFMFTRFDCPVCNDFFIDNYNELKREYVDRGLIRLVVRFLSHKDNINAFYAAKGAHYSFRNNLFEEYNNAIIKKGSDELNISSINEVILAIIPDTAEFNNYINNKTITRSLFQKATEARKAGINKSPTMIINDQVLVGNRNYDQLEEIINNELNVVACN